MSELRRYPDYKDSGVPWLGEIPSHWEAKAIKRISRIHRGASPRPIADSKYFDDEGEYAWVRIADVTASDDYLLETTQRLSELGASLSVKMQPDQIFLSIAGSVGKPIITKIKACIHDGFVYFPDWDQSTRFLYYIFASGKPYLGLGKLGTQLNLNTETVGSIKIGIPNLEEQQAIVNFLDTELEHIDTLIYRQQQLIEKLAEQRSAVITHAVTKGLDPDVPMKDSVVEWLGDIPEHCTIRSLKHSITYNDETLSDKTDPQYEFEYVDISSVSLIDGITNKDRLTFDNSPSRARRIVKKGDVIVSTVRTYLKAIAQVEEDTDDLIVSTGFAVLRSKSELNSEYLGYWVQSEYMVNSIMSNSVGVSYPAINATDLVRLPVILFPIDEQREIVSFLKKETQKIDQMSEATKGIIAKLQEYRSALITQAVTGKIDVRHINKKAS